MLTQHPDSSQAADWRGQDPPRVAIVEPQPISRVGGFLLGVFFVSVPVFAQAPLVRFFPWLITLSTFLWLLLGYRLLMGRSSWWGDLILGFAWSWLAGSIYWGWFRAEPLLHLPIEAIGLPFALWALWRGLLVLGHCFYLGSLLGTAITDFYFYALHLLPDWRRVMQANVQDSILILHDAALKVQTLEGLVWASIFVSLLLVAGVAALRSPHLHWWVFAGAVLGTLLVDALFGLSAFI